MASSYKDANPNAGAGKKGGMKNVDGRLKGAEFSRQVKASFDPKSVGVEPNVGAPKLNKGKDRAAKDKGAY